MKIFSTFLFFLTINYALACPNGSIAGGQDGQTCYKIFKTEKTWVEAEFDCQFNRGHLLSIHDAFTNTYLDGFAYENFGAGEVDYWLGGNAIMGNGWQWIDGSKFGYVNWGIGQPTNKCQSCLTQRIGDGKWSSACCNNTKAYICQIPPENAPICPENWTYVPSLKKCFYLSTVSRNWTDSETYCNSQGGNLAAVHSSFEYTQIKSIALSYFPSGYSFFIGLYNSNSSGWTWSDGTPLDYSNFYSSSPNRDLYAYVSFSSSSCSGWSVCVNINGCCDYCNNNNDYTSFAMCQKRANTY